MDVSRSTEVVVLIGTGAIGQAIARRIAPGKHLLLADVRESNAKAASDSLSSVGYQVSTHLVDVSSRKRYMRWQLQPPTWATSQV
jgi:saccharopine dehydrogenase-like NADP-dependent oxidoreductase